jgi:hypothetical protein
VTGFCLFLTDFDISLHKALPTTNPSAFLSDAIDFSVIPNPITIFLFLFRLLILLYLSIIFLGETYN